MQAYQNSAIGTAFTKLESVLLEVQRSTVGHVSRTRSPDAALDHGAAWIIAG